MPQLNKIFDQFNEMYGLETKPLNSNLFGMSRLIREELNEFWFEVNGDVNEANVVKEALDVVYITLQQLRERGVDLDAGLAELHRSNTSKTVSSESVGDELGVALLRYPDAKWVQLSDGRCVVGCQESGKVIKPTTYSPAVITPAIIKMPE